MEAMPEKERLCKSRQNNRRAGRALETDIEGETIPGE